MKNFIISLVIIFSFIFGCSKNPEKVKILVNSEFIDKNSVIIDDTLKLETYYLTDKHFTDFKINTGKHIVNVNDSLIKSFSVEKDDGILNVAQEEFVIIPIEYSTNEIWASLSSTIRCPVIIDSLIIYDSFTAQNQNQLLSKINTQYYKDQFSNNRVKFNKDILFIPKTWDYGVDDIVPDEINVRDDKMAIQATYKYKITLSDLYILYALRSENYKIEKIENEELKKYIIEIQNSKLLPKKK